MKTAPSIELFRGAKAAPVVAVAERAHMCPACESDGAAMHLQIAGFPILGCERCGHQFLGREYGEEHVAATYADAYFNDGGSGYPGYLSMADHLQARGASYARKIRQWAPGGRVLDVGCGAGFLLAGFEEEGWSGRGVEPNASMAAHGRKELGLQIEGGSFESFESEGEFDLVVLIQVIAHLYDPERSFEKVAKLVKPGGHVLVETWDNQSLAAGLLKGRWHEYDPPTVLNWFSRKSLAALAGRHGLRSVASRRTFKTISLAHGGSLLAHKMPALGFLRRLPAALRVPYPAADLFWTLFRK